MKTISMKINTLLLILGICLGIPKLNAQEEYTYTLIDNGAYSYSIAAVPNSSSSNFATSVQSYGFTILLPDGITATISTSLGASGNATFFNGADVGEPDLDGYLISEVLGAPIVISAPSSGLQTTMVTVQVHGNPTSGEIRILANNSVLASNITPLKAFMNADTIDDAIVNYDQVIDPLGSALSGNENFVFNTLAENSLLFSELSIYPNPAQNWVRVRHAENALNKVEIYSVNGQLLKEIQEGFDAISLEHLQAAVYLMKLYGPNMESKTFKLVKQ